MQQISVRRFAALVGGFAGAWLFLRYVLPLALPFLAGLLLALAAEPAVRLGTKLKLPRWAATGLGVSLTLVLLVTLVGILGAALVRELGVLAQKLPDLQATAQQATTRLETLLHDAAARTPENIRPVVDRSVTRLFADGSVLTQQVTVRLPGAVSSLLSRVPSGALGIGAGLLSGFMFSVRLPKLKKWLSEKMPVSVKTKLLPGLKRSKTALVGWLKAQLKLCGVTFGILLVGFLLLRIPLAPLWAALVAVVDAVPLLGTGAVLLPWALVSLLQHRHLQSIGLLCLWCGAVLTRTGLEPRLVGRHLGLDPLLTLVFLYVGYRFWGILGMLTAPMIAAALLAAMKEWKIEN